MPQHYSVQLGRWVDSDDDEETGFANEGLDAEGSNPYGPPPGPMPGRPDMEFSLDESERNARPDMEFSLEDSENNIFGKPDMEISPEEIDVDSDVRGGVNDLSPIRQQSFKGATLADDGDPDPEDNDMTIGAIETKRPLRADEWDTTSLPEALARDSVRPVTDKARQNLETGAGMPPPVQLEDRPGQGAWADHGPLSRPDETWAGAESPMREPIDVAGPPPGPLGPMPAPPPDLGPQQRQPVGPSQIRYDNSSKPGVTADPDGGQPDQVGVETENPDPLPARLARGRELWMQQHGGLETPEAQQEPYRPLRPQGKRPDRNLRGAFILQSIFGEKGDNFKTADMYRGLQHDYDQRNQHAEEQNLRRWLAEHKTRGDNGPISLAEVQQLIATGVEPEAAVHAGRGATKLASSLGGIATRERKIDADTNKTIITEREKDMRQERDQDHKGRMAGFTDETKRRGQDKNLEVMREKMQGQGQNTQDARAVRIQAAMKAGDLNKAEATDVVDNGTDSLRPSVRDRVDRALLGIDGQGQDGKAIGRIGASLTMGDARVADSVDRKTRDPGTHQERLKVREELANTDRKVDDALAGYELLEKNPVALAALVKIGQAGEDGKGTYLNPLKIISRAEYETKQAGLSPAEQSAIAAIMRLSAPAAVKDHGANFSESEQAMWGAGTGVTLGQGSNLFRSPKVVDDWLRSMHKARKSYRKNVAAEYEGIGGQ